jgi:beta-glucosidase
VTRPVKELKGFQRVDLKPGESKTVQITLTGTDLAFYDLDMNLALDSKRVQVLIGSSSENIHLSGEIEVLPPTTN